MAGTRQRLEGILRERIAVLDGSWGVLIQGQVRGEQAYRGERFRDHPRDVAGDPDLLNLTRPRCRLAHPRRVLRRGSGHRDDQHLHGDHDRPVRLRARGRRPRDERRRCATRPSRRGRVDGAHTRQAAVRRRCGRPAQRDALAVTARRRALLSCRDVRRGPRRVRTSDAGTARGRRRLLPDRDVFDSLNAKAAIVAAIETEPDVPLWLSFTAVDKSGRNLSGQTVEAFWNSVEHAHPLVVGVNCSLGAADMRPFVEDLSKHATTGSPVIRTRASRTSSAATTSSRTTRAACSASSRATVS